MLALRCSVMSNSLHPMDYRVQQAPLSMGIPGRNTGVGCHFLLQGTFPAIKSLSPVSPALAGGFFTISTPWETFESWLSFIAQSRPTLL